MADTDVGRALHAEASCARIMEVWLEWQRVKKFVETVNKPIPTTASHPRQSISTRSANRLGRSWGYPLSSAQHRPGQHPASVRPRSRNSVRLRITCQASGFAQKRGLTPSGLGFAPSADHDPRGLTPLFGHRFARTFLDEKLPHGTARDGLAGGRCSQS
jgi:hypothetical protein